MNSIPRVFWYSASFSLLVATVGLVFIAYKASDVTLEIAHTKINLVTAATDIQLEYEKLRQEKAQWLLAKQDYEKKIAELNRLVSRGVATTAEVRAIQPTTLPVKNDIDDRIESIKNITRQVQR